MLIQGHTSQFQHLLKPEMLPLLRQLHLSLQTPAPCNIHQHWILENYAAAQLTARQPGHFLRPRVHQDSASAGMLKESSPTKAANNKFTLRALPEQSFCCAAL